MTLQATKREFDPLGGAILYPILKILRWTAYQCPFCQRTFKNSWAQEAVVLGQGKRTCRKCGRLFFDGTEEWDDLSREERRLYLMPVSVAGVIGGFLVVAALTIYAGLDSVNRHVLLGFVELFLFFCAIWFGYRAILIAKSRARRSRDV